MNASPETLTEALTSLGIDVTPLGYGPRRLRRGAEVLSRNVSASAGWELVRLLRGGYDGTLDAAVERATEIAAEKAVAS